VCWSNQSKTASSIEGYLNLILKLNLKNYYSRYREKVALRDSRVHGFAKRFTIRRILYFIFLLPLVLLYPFFRIKTYNSVGYLLHKNHKKILNSIHQDILFIEVPNKKNFLSINSFYFSIFFLLSHMPFLSISKRIIELINPRNVFLSTDYGLDFYFFASNPHKQKYKSVCLQHGLFPLVNSCDLDGLDCDEMVVISETQKIILEKTGYKGSININKDLIKKYPLANRDSLQDISESSIIFIGPGYSHNRVLRKRTLEILKEIKLHASDKHILYFRPHPRDDYSEKEIIDTGFIYDNSSKTMLSNPHNLVYVGIKSTMLLEAQFANRISLLILDDIVPRYFFEGEIDIEIHSNDLKNLNKVLYVNAQ